MTRFEPGATIAGKYRILRELGSGGFGMVMLAEHEKLERRVALKLPHPELELGREATSRLVTEARLAAKIASDHVARVLDVDEDETGAPYIVLEHLEGRDLAGVLRDRGALPWREAVDYIAQAADAVGEAHSLGIVHRDIKPSNLFLVRSKPTRIKVLDFGIAVELDARRLDTRAGSPRYMAPEQLTGGRVDSRTDVWGLGVTLYELLTGSSPFQAPTLERVLAGILNEAPRPPIELAPSLPSVLDGVVLRCLRKDPAERFETVCGLLEALAELLPARLRGILERLRGLDAEDSQPSVRAAGIAGSSGKTTIVTRGDEGGSSTAALGRTLHSPKRLRTLGGAALAATLAIAALALWPALSRAPVRTLTPVLASMRSAARSVPNPPASSAGVLEKPPEASSKRAARPEAVTSARIVAPPPEVPSARGIPRHLLEDRE